MDEILNLIESVSEGFSSYFLYHFLLVIVFSFYNPLELNWHTTLLHINMLDNNNHNNVIIIILILYKNCYEFNTFLYLLYV